MFYQNERVNQGEQHEAEQTAGPVKESSIEIDWIVAKGQFQELCSSLKE